MSAIYGKNVGEEARYREKDILLGPGVNIYRTPLNGRNFEYMGEDPYLAGEMVVPYVKELQKNGVAASVKHFALNNQEKWRGNIDVTVSDRALYEIYLPAFKKAVIDGGAWTIMGAYNKYNGQHCCHNSRLLNDILRGEWGFDGCVVTDWGGAHDTKKIPAMFPFGHGLSYTTFKYGKPTVSAKEFAGDGSITVTVPVTNTGSMEGKEVVQLYISDEKSSLPRPLKELKGFSKVSLAPGATANVEFTIKADDLKFFDDKAHAWVAEPGKFKALIGSSSTDIRATVPFSFR